MAEWRRLRSLSSEAQPLPGEGIHWFHQGFFGCFSSCSQGLGAYFGFQCSRDSAVIQKGSLDSPMLSSLGIWGSHSAFMISWLQLATWSICDDVCSKGQHTYPLGTKFCLAAFVWLHRSSMTCPQAHKLPNFIMTSSVTWGRFLCCVFMLVDRILASP